MRLVVLFVRLGVGIPLLVGVAGALVVVLSAQMLGRVVALRPARTRAPRPLETFSRPIVSRRSPAS